MAPLKIHVLFLTLSYLLVLMSNYGNGAREVTKLDQENKILLPTNNEAHPTTKGENIHLHAGHVQFNEKGFFTPKDLYAGKVMRIQLPKFDPSNLSFFLPREKADNVPFSSKQLLNLLNFFSIPPGTPQALAIDDSLTLCEVEPLKGEIKVCTTSLESTLDFCRSVFGSEIHFEGLTTKYHSITDLEHNYTILEAPKEVKAPQMLACHLMPYPYGVFLCHTQTGGNRVFEVTFEAENGHRVDGVVVCHMDTLTWTNQNLFQQLGIKPGSSPVCHIFSPNNVIWVPITD